MTTTRPWRVFWAFPLLCLLLLLSALPTWAQGSASAPVSWQRFDVDLSIQPNGSVAVTETQSLRATRTIQEGYRVVPLDRTTGASDVSVAEVVDGRSVAYTPGRSRPNTFTTSVGSEGLSIDWWFSPTSATGASRTFVLRYVVSGAVRVYAAGDQLDWVAIYADNRAGLVDASTVTVHLPGDVDPSDLKSAWYRYPQGARYGALPEAGSGTQLDARTVQFTPGQLPSLVGAEVRVQFPHGLIQAAPPAWQVAADRADWLAQTVAPIGNFGALLLALAILAGGGAFMILLWYSSGRDPSIGSVPSEMPQPPSDLPAPLAGTLVDEQATEREAVATLVDLADRGLVQLKDEQNPQLIGSGNDVRIILQAPLDDPRVRGYERVLLWALFGATPSIPAEVLLSNAKAQFQASIPQIDTRLYEAVTQEGLFARNPETTRRRWRAFGIVLLLAGLGLATAAALLVGYIIGLGWLPGLALLIVGGVLTWLAGDMPRRTQKGALEAAKWRAFKAYLARIVHAQAPSTSLPAHYLAYAVAFGVDQAYVRHLEGVGTPPPRWYQPSGPGGVVFLPGGWYGGPWTGGRHEPSPAGGGGVAAPPAPPNPQGWSDALAALLNAASEAMAHGGGGGGWSGGGFGGGGGGGGGSGGFR
ncbi:MAG TPA: DUF2207 domain-containing protein [Chloroflexota bacterium]